MDKNDRNFLASLWVYSEIIKFIILNNMFQKLDEHWIIYVFHFHSNLLHIYFRYWVMKHVICLVFNIAGISSVLWMRVTVCSWQLHNHCFYVLSAWESFNMWWTLIFYLDTKNYSDSFVICVQDSLLKNSSILWSG